MQLISLSEFGIFRTRQLTRRREIWRNAARLVATRWDVFRQSEAHTRTFAFASYQAALDAEEAAAVDLARLIAGMDRHRAVA